MSIFKAYDIRGVYGQDLTEDDFYKIARAYVQFAGLKGGKVVVARDCRIRFSSRSVNGALVSVGSFPV